ILMSGTHWSLDEEKLIREHYPDLDYLKTLLNRSPSSIKHKACRLGIPSGKRLSKDLFITRSVQVHGYKYDYSKVRYSETHSKVEIVCPEHGSFFQTPKIHMKGHGCRACGNQLKAVRSRDTLDEFLSRPRKVQGEKSDYTKAAFLNSNTPVTIICPQHGDFSQPPRDHLSGHGCRLCSIERRASLRRGTTEDFLIEAR